VGQSRPKGVLQREDPLPEWTRGGMARLDRGRSGTSCGPGTTDRCRVLSGEGHQVLLDARARPTGLDRDSSDASRLVEREHDFELAGFSADRALPPKFTLQAG
jgi:hypothetical protein